jgi:hypothetical protein
MMTVKQPAMGTGVLWGGSTVNTENSLWTSGVRMGAENVCKKMSKKWLYQLVDPWSMTDSTESTLAFGESGLLPGLRVGPPSSWFYPHY